MRTVGKTLLAALTLLCLACAGAAPAQAAFGLNGFDVHFEEEDGSAASVAGSHPFAMTTVFHVNFHEAPNGEVLPDGEVKDARFEMPVGFAGNPTATPACARTDFLSFNSEGFTSCADTTAVGVVGAEIMSPSGPGEPPAAFAPVYNLQPPPGVAAELGFVVGQEPVTIDVGVKESAPFNVSAATLNTPQVVKFYGAELRIWGEPALAVHDPERGTCFLRGGSCPYTGQSREPFLTLPRACAGEPLRASFAATSWQEPNATPVTGASASALTPTDCESLGFGPTIAATPTTAAAESPSGLEFNLDVSDPGLTEPGGRADSDIKKAVVTLPQGVTTNSSVAQGLTGCSLPEFRSETLASLPGTGCAGSSKVGTIEVETPLLKGAVLPGSIYVAAQNANELGGLLNIYMVIKEPKLGILVRVPGKVEPDPVTGQLTTTFDNLPQLPFSHFHFHFREGDRAPLITPALCGTYTTTALLYPYSKPGSPLGREASFTVSAGADGGACVRSAAALPKTRGFSAGTVTPTAGAYSPFLLALSRPDGSQQISSIQTTLPEGLLGKLAGIPYCPEAGIAQAAAREGEGEGAIEVAEPSCPAASQVGVVTATAGAGTEPLTVTGKAYLGGPYKGAPLSLEIITPAIAGPFDLGVVAVRTALQVDPLTTEITAESDPIPTILHGLPLDLRSISIDMDRQGFTLNPTSCEPKSISGSAMSTLGNATTLSQYFQASECAKLKFKPTLKLSLSGSTRRVGHPGLRAVLIYPKGAGYSNIARAQVNLPHSEFIDQANLNKTCTKPVLLAGQCPASTVYGRAKAWTPLLEKPLEGNVYLVGGFGYKLPALVAELGGQIRVLLVGKVDSGPNHGIRNTFEVVPDAPVEKFELRLKGGRKYSLLENSENLCSKPQKAIARFTAQNGKVLQTNPLVANQCGKGKKNTGKKKHEKGAKGTHKKGKKSGNKGHNSGDKKKH